MTKIFPFGIYTIPEISQVGITESEVIDQGIDYCKGISYYKHIARARLRGLDDCGFLKILFKPITLEILGVQIIGYMASELIHYGMELIINNKKVTEVISRVFNYPTLHDLYKYACYDGLGNLIGHKMKDDE